MSGNDGDRRVIAHPAKDPPVRSAFPVRFMFNCKVELKAVAYKPLAGQAADPAQPAFRRRARSSAE